MERAMNVLIFYGLIILLGFLIGWLIHWWLD